MGKVRREKKWRLCDRLVHLEGKMRYWVLWLDYLHVQVDHGLLLLF